MRFGGHETFTIRRGWLSKGLRHVEAEPAAPFDMLQVIDALGIGRNMGRSIWHWLQVTGLAERQGDQMAMTGLGRLISEHDPSFSTPRAGGRSMSRSSPSPMPRWPGAGFSASSTAPASIA